MENGPSGRKFATNSKTKRTWEAYLFSLVLGILLWFFVAALTICWLQLRVV